MTVVIHALYGGRSDVELVADITGREIRSGAHRWRSAALPLQARMAPGVCE
jgi:hypothetical protein